VKTVNWFSTYHVHHRITQHFRKGRAFLCGDAAHVHSPAGGQGMNTGIGDAINLAWKLKADHAPDALLGSYEQERIAFARRLVQTTDRVFMLATAEGRLAEIVRTRVVPIVFPALARFEFFREFLFRTVSQVTINYRNCALNEGRAGAVQGGDRLPWVMVERLDNYDSLNAMVWQVHVYGGAGGAVRSWCQQHGLPLHEFAWRPQYGEAGFAQNALYLIRPDSYVASLLYLIRPDSYVASLTNPARRTSCNAISRNAESGSSRLVVRDRTRLNEAKSRLRASVESDVRMDIDGLEMP
jgi:hypothetical protein